MLWWGVDRAILVVIGIAKRKLFMDFVGQLMRISVFIKLFAGKVTLICQDRVFARFTILTALLILVDSWCGYIHH